MQCNGWSTTARFLQTINRPRSPISNHVRIGPHSSSSRAFSSQKLPDTKWRPSSLSIVSRTFSLTPAVRGTTRPQVVIKKPHPSLLKPTALSVLPPAKVSRVASQSIRQSAKENQFIDALYVLNSVRLSVNPFIPRKKNPVKTGNSGSVLPKQSFVTRNLPRYKFIDFGQAIPVRLAAHCFLHGLIRANMPKKAARQAELMMADGIRLRTKTLEAIIATNVSGAEKLKKLPRMLFGQQATRFTSNTFISDKCTRLAMDLTQQAKKCRQERTERMYDIIIRACLLQGEIIVASLLFIVLVKDWQLQKAVEASREAAAIQTAQPKSSPVPRPPPQAVYPSRALLIPILNHIEESISQQANEATDSPSFSLSLQALANLARLLDKDPFYTSHHSRLIKVLYSVPKSKVKVWSGYPYNPQEVNAYGYFHGVLKRLISRIIPKDGKPPQPVFDSFDFDRRTYNSLLHYALRHRISPQMANGLLTRIIERSKSNPDITTYNILLRSGTLLRRSDVSERVLTALRQNASRGVDDRASGSDVLAFGRQEPSSYLQAPWERMDLNSDTKFDQILQKLRNGDIIVPPGPEMQTDRYTLTSFIAHLTATGRPYIVAELLWYLLPELSVVDHPADSEQDGNTIRKMSREACVRRAVTYGPYVFTVILNALQKAGKTGLAERVWILAKEAERASWIDGFAEGVEPWCLPVHAYTCMIQCYADQGRKGLQMKEVYGQLKKNRDWTPKSGNRVKGWARFIYLGAQVAKTHNTRRAAARIMGILLHRSMESGAKAVLDAMKVLQDAKGIQTFPSGKVPSVPTPDARYFNAALRLFGRQVGMRRRATKSKKSHWRWLLRKSKTRFEKHRMRSIYWQPIVQEIAQEMVQRGYSVPWGYRFIFVGRGNPGTSEVKSKQRLEVRPMEYPNTKARFQPQRVSTSKARGLPVGTASTARRRSRASILRRGSNILIT